MSVCPNCGRHGFEITAEDSTEREFGCWEFEFNKSGEHVIMGCATMWTTPFGCPECRRDDGEHDRECPYYVKGTTTRAYE